MKKFFRKFIVFILHWQVKLYIKKNQPKIILVCGQINRSNTKQEIVDLLKSQGFNLRDNIKGYNSEIGLPLTILDQQAGFASSIKWFKLLFKIFFKILQKKQNQEILVLELAISNYKNLTKLISEISPSIVVFSDFFANFSQKSNILSNYTELCKQISRGLILVDQGLQQHIIEQNLKAKVITYSLDKQQTADIRAELITEFDNGQEFFYSIGDKQYKTKINKFSNYNIVSFIISKYISLYLNKEGI